MAKEALLREAKALGIEGLDEESLNRTIQEAIDQAKAESAEADSPESVDASESAEDGAEEPAEAPSEEVADPVSDEAPVASVPTFQLDQLKPYSDALFGYGAHVLVGARSAGCIPDDPVTKEQVSAGVDQYLNMPVKQEKEG